MGGEGLDLSGPGQGPVAGLTKTVLYCCVKCGALVVSQDGSYTELLVYSYLRDSDHTL